MQVLECVVNPPLASGYTQGQLLLLGRQVRFGRLADVHPRQFRAVRQLTCYTVPRPSVVQRLFIRRAEMYILFALAAVTNRQLIGRCQLFP